MVIYSIQSRLRAPDHGWSSCSRLRPETRDEAEKLCDTLHRAMPMKDFRVVETYDEDIPF